MSNYKYKKIRRKLSIIIHTPIVNLQQGSVKIVRTEKNTNFEESYYKIIRHD